MTDKDLEFAFDLNVWAQVRAIKAVLPQMLERADGCVINMAPRCELGDGRPQPRRLLDFQGRRDRPHQVDRRRLHHEGHPRERHRTGYG